MRKSNFAMGAAILAVAGILCKIIGAAFRIPLSNIVGTNGMAYYQVAYPVYTTLLTVSTAGIPAAISKMVAEQTAHGDHRNAHYTFQVAFRLLLGIGVIGTLIIALFSGIFAAAQGVADATPTVIAIAPALLFVSVLSAYRGYFQGLNDMVPTAISQVIEQVVKLGAGILFALMMVKHGPVAGATGAIIGVSLSELAALVYLMISYARRKGEIRYLIRTSPRVRKYPPKRVVMRRLLAIAVPITIGASIMPLISLLDNALVINNLKAIGFGQEIAESRFAILTAYVIPIINMPTILSSSLQVSLVPAMSHCVSRKDARGLRFHASSGLRIALLMALPCAVGLAILGEPIMGVLYRELATNPQDLTLAGTLVTVYSVAGFFLMLTFPMTGILQGMGHPSVPVRNMAIGAILKIVFSIILLRVPEINIVGAAIGSAVCYGASAILNTIAVIRYTGMRFLWKDFILRPLGATIPMGAVAYFSYQLFISFLPTIVALGGAILLAVIVYAVLILVLQAIRPEDMRLLPGGNKLDYLMRRIGIWR